MKEIAIVVWSAVLAFLGGGVATFVYLWIADRSKAAPREEDYELVK